MSLRFVRSAGRHLLGDVQRRGSLLGLLAVGLATCAACGTVPAAERATLTAAETTPSTPSEVTAGDPQIAPEPTGGPTPAAGRPWDAEVSATCSETVGAGFGQAAQSADGGGVTTFWVRGRDWRVCDVAGAEGAEPTVFGPDGRLGRDFDLHSLGISTSTVSAAGQGGATRVVAGGLLSRPVDEIRYVLPDGTTSYARFVTTEGNSGQTWWVMTHEVPEAALAGDPGPVTMSVLGATAEAFRVPWEQIQRSE